MADSSSFDYWSADGELALYPPHVNAGSFDYWSADGELASYPPGTAVANDPGTAANDNDTGTIDWTDPDNVLADDANDAEFTAGAGATTSHYLKVTNFGFALPATATINGIKMSMKIEAESADNMYDDGVYIVKDDVIGTTDMSSATAWPTTESRTERGNPTNKWGESWNHLDINKTGFGVAVSAIGENNKKACINHIRMIVYYTEMESGSVGQVVSRIPINTKIGGLLTR